MKHPVYLVEAQQSKQQLIDINIKFSQNSILHKRTLMSTIICQRKSMREKKTFQRISNILQERLINLSVINNESP